MQIEEKVNNVVLYLTVEPNYEDPTEGQGKQDAIIFETGNVKNEQFQIDSVVCASVDVARSFALEILETCKEIESGDLNEGSY